MIYKLFKSEFLRELYGKYRFYKLIGNLDTFPKSNKNLKYQYSLEHFKIYASIPHRVTFLVSVIKSLNPNRNAKLLVLGPRYESELFGYRGLGFKKKNIEAIDLFTYSPLINKGDAHSLNYGALSFDFVIAGWTFPYSSNPQQMLNECFRCLKPNGFLVITYDLRGSIERHLSSKTGKKFIKIPLVSGKLVEISLIKNNHKMFETYSYTLSKIKWRGSKESTPIGCIILTRK